MRGARIPTAAAPDSASRGMGIPSRAVGSPAPASSPSVVPANFVEGDEDPTFDLSFLASNYMQKAIVASSNHSSNEAQENDRF